MKTKIKICGITKPEDAKQAAALGVDAIGLMFYANSPRFITVAQAQQIVAGLPPFLSIVGVFVDAPRIEIEAALAALPISCLQFHGEESASECEAYGLPYIKVIRMREGVDVHALSQTYHSANALLLDTYQADVLGGTGKTFVWQQVPQDLAQPIIIAGGLTAANVGTMIQQVNPYGVDVSSGVESSQGIKDPVKLTAFVKAVRES